MGFGKHPHDNMEIISIPLEGDLEHQDSMGNTSVIKNGDVQIMSAGTGITHSEYNNSKTEAVKFLQIWVFPNQRNVTPRYQQISLNKADRINKFQQIISPSPEDEGLWMHQNTWFYLGDLSIGSTQNYQIKGQGNGLYIFVLKGQVQVADFMLSERDGLGLWDFETISFVATTDTQLLLMEVPLEL
jgi:redox-sensitive bicupin YhaK (pirin superfamily)